METRTVILALVGALILAIIHGLDKKLPRFKSISDGLRVVLASGLGIGTSIVDAMTQDAAMNFKVAALNALAVSGPSFVVIFVSWLAGSDDPASTDGEKKDEKPTARWSLSSISRSLKMVGKVGLTFAVITMTGCAGGLSPTLNEVVTDVSDAAQILNVIRSVVTIFFLSHPSPDSQVKVEEALAKAQLALDASIRATKGAQSLTQKDNDAAFNDFRAAYEELGRVLRSVGIADASGKLAVKRDGTSFSLPSPLALKR